VATSKSWLTVINLRNRDILSDREPPEHHAKEYITGGWHFVECRHLGTRREKIKPRPTSRKAPDLKLQELGLW
jgi:hypothetical protein